MKVGLSHLSDKALYREYWRRIDPREVLSHYGAENTSERINRDGTQEIVHSCLLEHVEPHHRNGDLKPSASMNIDHKMFNCYAYWGGSIFNFIMKMEQKESFTEIVPVLQPLLTGAEENPDSFRKLLERLFDDKSGIFSLDLPSYSEQAFKSWLLSHPYLREVRGIDLETSSKLKIGYDPEDNRVVFFHYFGGKLVGYQKRGIPSGYWWPATTPEFPKYKSSLSFPKSSTLYNYDRLKGEKICIVVESPMSVAKAYTFGIENVVATFGAKVTEGQIALLKGFDNVIVWMDRDSAGDGGEKNLVRSLYRHTKVTVVNPDEGKDLADYTTRDEVEAKIDSAVPAMFKLVEYERQEKEHARRRVRAH